MRSERCVVIGAGIMGSAIGMELARAGHEVVIVDKGAGVGHGSTSASSAVIRFGYSTVAGTALAYESMHYWKAWADHIGLTDTMLTRFVQCGKVLIDDRDGMAQVTLEPMRAAGVHVELWSPEQLRERFPLFDTGSYWPPARVGDESFWDDADRSIGDIIWTPEAGYVSDPQLAAQNLADAAVAAGATVRLGRTVTAVHHADGAVTGVALDNGETIDCSVAVNAAGPHSSKLNELAGVADSMVVSTRALRQQVDHVTAPSEAADEVAGLPVVADLDLGTYFRAESGGALIGGVEAPCDPLVWLDEPDEVDLSLDGEEWETKTLRLARRLPAVGVPHERRGVVGVYDVSDDWIPVLDRSDLDGWFMAIGTSGNQFKNAPGIGHLMAELIAAVGAGHDHDADPLVITGRHTGLSIDLSTFSRNRSTINSTGTVMG